MSDKHELPTVGGLGGESCEECRWWDQHGTGEGNIGQCHRLPPVMLFYHLPERYHGNGSMDQHGIWPITMCSDWCGEYRARAEK